MNIKFAVMLISALAAEGFLLSKGTVRNYPGDFRDALRDINSAGQQRREGERAVAAFGIELGKTMLLNGAAGEGARLILERNGFTL